MRRPGQKPNLAEDEDAKDLGVVKVTAEQRPRVSWPHVSGIRPPAVGAYLFM